MQKKALLTSAQKVTSTKRVTPQEVDLLLHFEPDPPEHIAFKALKGLALPLSLILGFLLAVFSDFFDELVTNWPTWTNLHPQLLAGFNYIWTLLSDPIEKSNILFHLPNIVLYSFGVVGVKKVLDSLEHRRWLDKVLAAQTKLQTQIKNGSLKLSMKPGHSLLFVGKGDFIGTQFALNHKPDQSVTIAQTKPNFTDIWNYYHSDSVYDDLKTVLLNADCASAGEYVFFPVKDDQIFLPSSKAYDLSPHKLDILCQNIRTLEKESRWKSKRILIVGDKFHKSFVQSEDKQKVIPNSEDIISLASIAGKYQKVSLFDPTDIVLSNILLLANKRRIVFRATKEGIAEYKQRFYDRLELLGYKPSSKAKGTLTIGYDIFEDQTEQQTLSRKIDDYLPVVLSKNVRDALIRNGYKKQEFLYVPDLVLAAITKAAAEQ